MCLQLGRSTVCWGTLKEAVTSREKEEMVPPCSAVMLPHLQCCVHSGSFHTRKMWRRSRRCSEDWIRCSEVYLSYQVLSERKKKKVLERSHCYPLEANKQEGGKSRRSIKSLPTEVILRFYHYM